MLHAAFIVNVKFVGGLKMKSAFNAGECHVNFRDMSS